MTPVLTITAAQLRATAADDEQPVEAPRRGRPRKHPPGEKPKQGPRKRAAVIVRAYPPSPIVRARWQAAAEARGLSLSAFVTGAATAAADAALGPEAPDEPPAE